MICSKLLHQGSRSELLPTEQKKESHLPQPASQSWIRSFQSDHP